MKRLKQEDLITAVVEHFSLYDVLKFHGGYIISIFALMQLVDMETLGDKIIL